MQRMRARADGRRGSRGIEAVVALRDVDDDGNAAGLRDRLERRDERRGGNDDLVAGLDARSPGGRAASASSPLATPTQWSTPQ